MSDDMQFYLSLFGVSFVFCLILWYFFHIPERPKETPKFLDKWQECDTCGQVTSELEDGLCSWCKNVYKNHRMD